MIIRRLLAPLLFLPLLVGASVHRVEVRAAPDGGTAFVASDALTAGPALPGTTASTIISGFVVSAPARAHDRLADALVRAGCDTARAVLLEREFLRCARTLERARLASPATCGNPPPASAS